MLENSSQWSCDSLTFHDESADLDLMEIYKMIDSTT